jgi:hypothetical protein
MKNIKYLTILLTVGLITIYGCKKDEENVIDNQTTSAKDNSTAENLFGDIKRIVEEVANDEGQSSRIGNKSHNYSFGSCALVSINPAWVDTVWPKVITIDFGTTNCTGSYGINRRGKVIITLTDSYRNAGSVLTVQPQNYYVNDHKIEGTKTLTNNGLNANNNLSYSVNVTNGKITYTDGSVAQWTSTRTNEWIEGDTTSLLSHGLPGLCDDVYLITGSANGVNRNGLNYTVNITSPLRKEICCRWLVSGTLDVIPSGLATRTVDFGNGNCDNMATITINGNTFNVPMF